MSKYVLCAVATSLSVFSLALGENLKPIESGVNSCSLPVGGDFSLALDTFRCLPDGSWGGNMGAYGALNLAYAIPKAFGMGIQLGGSYGAYDWEGRGSNFSRSVQQEAFVSGGVFRVTPKKSGLNIGVVYDWLYNKDSGVLNLSPSLSQIRGQVGYLIKESNEVGLWGSYGLNTVHLDYDHGYVISFSSISQINAFWRHIFKNSAETTIWGGSPYRKGLMFSGGRAGSFTLGGSFKAPITQYLSLNAYAEYMGARTDTGDIEANNYGFNVGFALTCSFGGRQAGARPYLPIGNNSNFMVDTNLAY